MMMADDKNKKQATIILSSMKPKSEEQPTESPASEIDFVAEDILAAVEKKDAKALAEALRSFHSMCMDSESEESSESESEQE